MKIRTKLLLALSPLLILLLILIGFGRFQMAKYNDISNTLETNYNLSVLATSIQRDIKDEAISLRNLFIYEDEDLIQREISMLEEHSEQVSENIARLRALASTDEPIRIIGEINNQYSVFNLYKARLIEFIVTGKRNDAFVLMKENSAVIQKEFQDLISDLTLALETNMYASLETEKQGFTKIVLVESIVSIVITIGIIVLLFRSIWSFSTRLNKMANVMGGIANGRLDLTTKVDVKGRDEFDEVADSFNQMTSSLEEQMMRQQDLSWINSNIAEITMSMSGARTVESLTDTFLSKIVPLIGGSHAVFYVVEDEVEEIEAIFKLRASYAFRERKHMTTTFRSGEGLIGQCALEKKPITLSKVPSDYITVKSGLGEAAPLTLYLLPILFEGEVNGVVEIASFEPIIEKEKTLLEELINDLGMILESVIGRIKQAKLLEETQILMEEIQAQSEELQTQQDELKATNEELEQQTTTLRQSEEKLQLQQEELEQTNVELEEKAHLLEKQNQKFEMKNVELEKVRVELEEQARQLNLSSKYKSEFLANISHELRTPLNSLLILSNLLSENKEETLSPKQVKFAKTIHASGKELLSLINDILDLSKIESGKMNLNLSKVFIKDIAEYIESNFRIMASDKNLGFKIELQDGLPEFIYSDEVKINQVLKNLLSNAFKFTNSGEVRLSVGVDYSSTQPSVVFSVSDTGIGIAEENQALIFEAFQQVDGTTSRRFGGTGLGLSISKEIANLLNGKIFLYSLEGKGSTFSFQVGNYKDEESFDSPREVHIEREDVQISNEKVETEILPAPLVDDQIKKLLIVDDDLNQRNSLMELISDMDFILKAVSTGAEALVELKRRQFDCVIVDLGLTDISGFKLIEDILGIDKSLKIFVYTGKDLSSKEELLLNQHAHAIIIKDEHSPQRLKEELSLYLNETSILVKNEGYVEKDHIDMTGLEGKKVLLVDDDVRNVFAISSTLEHYGMDIRFAENGIECLNLLKEDPSVDIIIMDIMMPEMDGYQTIHELRRNPKFHDVPIISLTAKAMKEDREKILKVGASDYIMKPVDSKQLMSLLKVWLFKEKGITTRE
ncbi:response regulator [Sporosarcina highlanderae]|uniref:histidine kinase n=1 Tax=Sporosarcina highlanderae TaxID=3035916 RepID=A0ABT8JPU3_9BACL|nr:response regulator [Sporosarcina highlanderae]MDN4607165.1 response regulator [Sporosarcina highlanderae]